MTCALILIANFWVNPCEVAYIHPWTNVSSGKAECVLVFTNDSRHATSELTCEEVAEKLNG